MRTHEQMTDSSSRERALRKLPLPYSLALRLRDAGAAPDVVAEYVGVEVAALDGLYHLAEAKLASAQKPWAVAAADPSASDPNE
jgi:hypothetical protein